MRVIDTYLKLLDDAQLSESKDADASIAPAEISEFCMN